MLDVARDEVRRWFERLVTTGDRAEDRVRFPVVDEGDPEPVAAPAADDVDRAPVATADASDLLHAADESTYRREAAR